MDLRAQFSSDRAGTAEFQFVETLVYARPAGLAGAYTSLAQSEDAVGYNPAGISKLERRRSVAGTFRYHFLDISTGNVTYAFPGAGNRNYAFSAAYINYGNIREMDEEGNSTGKDIIPTAFSPSFTAAFHPSDQYRLGATLKGVSQYLGDLDGAQMAWGWGADLGMLYQPKVKNLGFGLSLLNVGRKESAHLAGGDKGGLLPASLKGGMFYYPSDLPKARVAVDVELPWHDSPLLSGGLEYAYSPYFMLRAGSRINWPEMRYYYRKATDQATGALQGENALKVAGGLSFLADEIALDYALQYWLGLSWVHVLTVKHAFGI